MPEAKNHPATHKQRWQAVNLKDLHPELSYRQIGSKIGRSQTFASKWIRLARLHNSVADIVMWLNENGLVGEDRGDENPARREELRLRSCGRSS